MAVSLEVMLLTACKTGDIETVRLATSLRVDVNCNQGWGLRRAIRHNHPQIWDSLLLHRCINVNVCNQYGLSALHTACRFNIGSAVSDLLRHPGIAVNDQTVLGSTPLMVAVKYASKQALQILIRDKRVDLDVVDNQHRSLEKVIGVACNNIHKDDKEEILEILQDERRFRQEGAGRRLSLEEEGLAVDSKHRTRVFGKLKELLEELKELQHNELIKVELRQEDESRQMQSQANYQINQLLANQEQEREDLMTSLLKEKEEMDTRHTVEIERLVKKQDEASQFLQRKSDGESAVGQSSSPLPTLSGSPVHSNTNRLSVSSMQSLSTASGGDPFNNSTIIQSVTINSTINSNNETLSNSIIQQHLITNTEHNMNNILPPQSQQLTHSSSQSVNSTVSELYQQMPNSQNLVEDYPHSGSDVLDDGGQVSSLQGQVAPNGTLQGQIPTIGTLQGQVGTSSTLHGHIGTIVALQAQGGVLEQGQPVYSGSAGGEDLPAQQNLVTGSGLTVDDSLASITSGLPNQQLLGGAPSPGGSESHAASVTAGSSSPWETGARTPDEGYLTSKDQELPQIIHSTCKELECPICMEVMAPPNRIWQCKMGHVICETCKERVRKESGASELELPCPTCKTAPFIGRNLALERVARSLFLSK